MQFEGDPINLLELNTPEGENFLVLNPHRSKMAFTREGSSTGISESQYIEQFFQVFDSSWAPPRIFTNWENEQGMFSPIGFDQYGNEYFNEVSFVQGVYTGRVSKFVNDGGVAYVDVPFLNSKSAHQSGCLSKDGKFMIISMESNYTYGVEDLYVIKRKSMDEWSSPINLGSQINSEFQEITPYLAPDNKTLFFATNGRMGEGSFDIYYSKRLDNSWRNWSYPINLGTSVNTSGSETSFSFLDGDEWAYFVSSQSSDGYGDIMRIKIKDPAELEEVVVEDSIQPTRTSAITLKVVDKKTGLPIWSDLIRGNETTTSEIGVFNFDELTSEEVEIKSLGYLPHLIVLNVDLNLGENVVELEPVTVGNTITLNHVLFYRGIARMIEESEKELDLVVEMMNDNPDIKILLKGHTDNVGDPVLNLRLSEARAKSVRKYLITQGINAYRIKSVGYGGNAPIASNATEETRKLNRRVEFEVIEN